MTEIGFVATGYTLVVPPGWVRVPVNGDADKELDRAIDRAIPADLPRDEATPLKVKIKGRLLTAASEARDAGALDLYLPLEGMHGLAIPASFLVTDIPVAADQHPDVAWTEFLATGAVEAEIDGDPALRLDEIVEADPLMTEVDVPARRITYLVPAPGSPRWIGVVYSTVGDGDPRGEFAEVLVALFDAIMTTFRWRGPAAE